MTDLLTLKEPIASLVAQAWAAAHPEKAQALASEALTLCEAYPEGAFESLRCLMQLAFNRGAYDIALEKVLKAVEIGSGLTAEGQATILREAGSVYYMLGERAQALDYFHQSLKLAYVSKNNYPIARAYNSLGYFYVKEQATERALEYLEEALPYTVDNPIGEAYVRRNLSQAHCDRGDLVSAQQYAQEALELGRKHDIGSVESYALYALAQIARKEANLDKALGFYQEILDKPNRYHEAANNSLIDVAEIHLERADVPSAVTFLERTLQAAKDSEVKLLLRCYEGLHAAHKQGGDLAKALDYHEKFHALYKHIHDEENEVKIRALDVAHRMDSLRRESELLAQKNEELRRTVNELEEMHQKVRELSIRDALTGLYNRRYLFEQADNLLKLAGRYGRPLSVAMLDIDHFKSINDTFGHKVGDNVLRQVGELLKQVLRDADPVARYGGEEFAIMLPATPLDNAVLTCERLRKRFECFNWRTIHPDLRVTISIGIISDLTVKTVEDLFALADAELYKAKRGGRNRVSSGVDTVPLS